MSPKFSDFIKISIVFLFVTILASLMVACKKPKDADNRTVLHCQQDFSIEPANYNSDSVSVFCPNLIVPDHHGAKINNRFFFIATGITGIDYSIYQNGNIVYSSQDINEGWNAVINGDTAYGRFQYLAIMTTIRNETITAKGSFISKPSYDSLYSCQECRFSDQIKPGVGFVFPTLEVAPCAD